MLNSDFLPGYLSQSENIEELPKQSDVVIIGGGLLGTALSYYLAKAGVEVTLLERNGVRRVTRWTSESAAMLCHTHAATLCQGGYPSLCASLGIRTRQD